MMAKYNSTPLKKVSRNCNLLMRKQTQINYPSSISTCRLVTTIFGGVS